MITKQDLLNAHTRIRPYIHRTPILTSRLLDEITGTQLYLKCENLQRMGAFKMRGATNAIMQLSAEEKVKGVVTHSSGNFAQALALSANMLGIKAYIVMPENAPKVKKEAVDGYGGEIIECESTVAAREATANEVMAKTGASFIHPYNDFNVIAGNSTATLELLQEQPDMDYIFAPVGGGGLISGTALAAHFLSENCKVIGGEPFEADDAYRSLQSGLIEQNITINTIADGLRTNLGDKTFPIIQEYVHSIVRVTEQEIVRAMRLLWERLKIVVEPSGAVSFAAALKSKEMLANKKTGILISGGNVDLDHLPFSSQKTQLSDD